MKDLVPAAAALLGASVGAVVTVMVTSGQIESNERTARQERRETRYAEVVISGDNYAEALWDLWERGGSDEAAAADAAKDEFNAAVASVEVAATNDIELTVSMYDSALQQVERAVEQHVAGEAILTANEVGETVGPSNSIIDPEDGIDDREQEILAMGGTGLRGEVEAARTAFTSVTRSELD